MKTPVLIFPLNRSFVTLREVPSESIFHSTGRVENPLLVAVAISTTLDVCRIDLLTGGPSEPWGPDSPLKPKVWSIPVVSV